jgi:hypothetical protein
VAVAAVALAATLAGTFWGADDDFPVGPFRMYATSARATGTVRTAQLYGVTAAGTEILLQAGDVGLRRAELEGQLPRFRAHPDLLAALARPEYVAVRLVERVRFVVDRRVQRGEERRVVAEWRRG